MGSLKTFFRLGINFLSNYIKLPQSKFTIKHFNWNKYAFFNQFRSIKTSFEFSVY